MANLATINNNILADSGIDPLSLIVGTGTVNYVPKFTAEDTVANSQIFDNGTNIGIGTTSPSAKLNVVSSSLPTIISNTGTGGVYQSVLSLRSTSPSYGAGVQFYDGTNDGYISWYNQGLYFAGTGGATRMLIDSSGKLLVGGTTNTYGARVSVENGFLAVSESGGSDILLRAAYGSGNPAIQVVAAVPLVFATSNTERMRIDADGRVLINRTASTGNGYYLQVTNGISTSSSLLAQGTLSGYSGAGAFLSYETYGGRLEAYDYSTTSWKNIAISPNGGNVGIGTSSPSYKLDINGQTRFQDIVYFANGNWNKSGDGFNRLYFANAGRTYFGSGNGYEWRSDGDAALMVLTNGGNLLVGTTTDAGYKLDVNGTGRYYNSTNSNFVSLTLSNTNAGSSARNVLQFMNDVGGVGLLDVFSSTWSASGGDDVANGLRILAPGSGGLSLRASTSTIRFYTGSSERMRIATTGAVQFNAYGSGSFTGTVAYNLAVDASGNIIETAGGVVDGSGTANYVPLWSDPNTLTNSTIYQTGGGNVGINTASPAYKLDVNGTARASGMTLNAFATGTSGGNLELGFDGTQGVVQAYNRSASWIPLFLSGSDMRFYPGGVEKMRLDSVGNLGIGTSSPGYKTEIRTDNQNATQTLLALTNSYGGATDGARLLFQVANTGGNGAAITGKRDGGTFGIDLLFETSSGVGSAATEKMRITSTGNVGIGTSSPSLISGYTGLNVLNSGYTQIKVQSTLTSAGIEFSPSSGFNYEIQASNSNQWFVYDRTSNAYRLVIHGTGNVSIGSNSDAGYKLDVNGIVRATGETILSGGTLYLNNTDNSQAAYLVSTGTGGSAPLIFATNSSERMRLDASGNLGIGLSSSLRGKLDVGGFAVVGNGASGVSTEAIRFSRSGDDFRYQSIFTTSGGSAAANLMQFNLHNFSTATSQTTVMTLNGAGAVRFNAYGSGSFTGTRAYDLSVDASGNIIEVPVGAGTITGSGTTNYIPKFTSSSAIGNSNLYEGTYGIGLGTAGPQSSINNLATTIQVYQNSANGSSLKLSSALTNTELYQADSAFYIWNYGGSGAPILFGTNNSERMRLDASGNLGLGRTPAFRLDVQTSAVSGGVDYVRFQNGASNAAGNAIAILLGDASDNKAEIRATTVDLNNGYLGFYTQGSGSRTEKMRLDASGNLAIAQGNAPTQALNIYRAGSTQTVMAAGNSNTGLNGTYFGVDPNGNGIINTTGAFANIFSTNGSERMRITSGGDVGIGTTAPSYKLDVQEVIRSKYGSNEGSLYLGGTPAGVAYVAGAVRAAPSPSYSYTGKLSFYTTTWGVGTDYGITEQMYIDTTAADTKAATLVMLPWGGNVGIGTTSPTSRLQSDKSSTYNSSTPSGAIIVSNLTGTNAILDIGVDATYLGYIQSRYISNTTYYSLSLNPLGGNVGIGTISPLAKLDLTGGLDGTYNSNILINSNASTAKIAFNPSGGASTGIGGGNGTLLFYTNGANTERARIDASGNFLIGSTTNEAGSKLYVLNSITTDYSGTIGMRYNVSGYTNSYYKGMTGTALDNSTARGLHIFNYDADSNVGIQFWSNARPGSGTTPQVIITSSGNVGIGTTSPATTLDVRGNAQVKPSTGTDAIWNRASNDSGEFYLGIDNSAGSGFTGTAYARFLYATGGYPITLHTNGNERMRITSGGNVGIGTSSPTVKLDIEDLSTWAGLDLNGGSGGEIRLQKNGTTYGQIYASDGASTGFVINAQQSNNSMQFQTAGVERMRITSGGLVGIGTSSPSDTLHVTGSVRSNSGSSYEVTNHGTFTLNDGTLGNYVDFLVVGSTNVGSSFVELTLSETNIGHGSIKYFIPTNYDDVYVSQTRVVLPLYTTNPRFGYAGGGYGSAIQELQIIANNTGNYTLRLVVRKVGDGSAPAWYWTAKLKNCAVSSTPNTTGINSTAYSLYRHTPLMQYDNKVGIGTAQPSATLNVVSTGNAAYTCIVTEDNARRLKIGRDQISAYDLSENPAQLYIQGNGSNVAMVTAGGNVGIGTSGPSYKLDVVGTTARVRDAGNVNYVSLSIYGGVYLGGNGTGGVRYAGTETNDNFALVANNSEKVRITTGGYVGIGTSNPTCTLDVRTDSGVLVKGATSDIDGRIALVPASGGRQYGLRNYGSSFGIKDESADVIRMYFHYDGNTGIGTTSPSYKLDVVGNIASNAGTNEAQVFVKNSTSSIYLFNSYAGNSFGIFDGTAGQHRLLYDRASNFWAFYTGASERMRITSGGNLLVGTTSDAGYKLDVTGTLRVNGNNNTAVALTVNGSDASEGLVAKFARGASEKNFYISATNNQYVNLATEGNFRFKTGISVNQPYTSGNDPMVLTSTGNVGIGTSSPTVKLQVSGTTLFEGGYANFLASGTIALRIGADGSNDIFMPSGRNLSISAEDNILFRTSGALTERFRITSSGNVGIGTSSPSGQLEVYEGFYKRLFVSYPNSTTTRLSIGHNFYIDNDQSPEITSFTNSSGTSIFRWLQGITPTERMRLSPSGNLLIGTTSDAGQKLQVNGNGYFNGNLETTVDLVLSRTDVAPAIVTVNGNLRLYKSSGAGAQYSLSYDNDTITFSGSIKTAAPSGGTAATWKLGSRISNTCGLPLAYSDFVSQFMNTNKVIEVEIGGVTVYIPTVTPGWC